MNHFNWNDGFVVDFDLDTGKSDSAVTSKRPLSVVKDIFLDTDAAAEILKKEDPMIYEFHELGAPERKGDLAFGTTVIYPGKIGNEYYMTKGHFHTILETAEVYYTLQGAGYMVMENPEGDTIEKPLKKGDAVYVPRRYSHRTVNTGSEPLVLFYTFDADAGHDYGTIEENGYRKMIVEEDGKAVIVDNPRR
ncbi:MAG: cupin domain-containing protein [Lachnospiraceae bacterium]|nr:cupin domain-containing protein [Lachnospiraceae bacterium]